MSTRTAPVTKLVDCVVLSAVKGTDGTVYMVYEALDTVNASPENEWVSFDVNNPTDPGEGEDSICTHCGSVVRVGWFALSLGTILCWEHVEVTLPAPASNNPEPA